MKINLALLIIGAQASLTCNDIIKVGCPPATSAANGPTAAPTTQATTAAPTTVQATTTLAPTTTVTATLSQSSTPATTTYATATPTSSADNSSSPNTTIIASAIGGGFVLVIIAIIVGTYLYKRRDDRKFNAKLSLDPANTIPRRKTTLPFFKKKNEVQPSFAGPVDLPSASYDSYPQNSYQQPNAYQQPLGYQPSNITYDQPRVSTAYETSAGYPTTIATFSSGDYPDGTYPPPNTNYPPQTTNYPPPSTEITPPF
ncbi:hypothetical protein HDV04_000506 [Boothiomyces sp. JEL0838]|nr:hypothetical protein HDV04_000506 [Boothiomyces sp. JEL0838]